MQGTSNYPKTLSTGNTRPVTLSQSTILRPCPLCGSHSFTPVLDRIKRCKHCKFSFVNPLGPYRGENETEEYFLYDYLPLHFANRENSLAERRSYLSAITKRFQVPPRASLLDVGCALGFMLHEAKEAGWEPQGVETSEFAAKYAAEHTGCPVHTGTLEDAHFASSSFDAVTLTDVIEHVAEPVRLVSEIHRILRPGGVVLIVTPNFGSLFVRLYGLNAYGVWPDQHVVYFQPSTISYLLKNVGFNAVIAGSRDFYAENLRRLMGGRAAGGDIKAAFGGRRSLGKVRTLVNSVLMRIPVGDKLVAFAQK